MDHEFWFEGSRPVARLPLEQQAIGQWLTDEIADNLPLLKALITSTTLLIEGGLSDYRWQGRESLLILNREEAEIIGHTLLQDEDIPLDDPDLELHDSDMRGGCGLEDFLELLQAWKAFVSS